MVKGRYFNKHCNAVHGNCTVLVICIQPIHLDHLARIMFCIRFEIGTKALFLISKTLYHIILVKRFNIIFANTVPLPYDML